MKLLLASACVSPGNNEKGQRKVLAVALFVLALMVPGIGQAQPVKTAAKPENADKKPAPPAEINYTVTEVFPLQGKFIAAVNRSRELALIGDFAGSFVDRKRKVQTLNAQCSPMARLTV